MDWVIEVNDLSAFYGKKTALRNISVKFPKKGITAIIGPSGCGKSTLVRCLNRMNDEIPNFKVMGEIYFEGKNIYDPDINLTEFRKKVGMVFQKPTVFPMSIYDNVAFGPRIHGIRSKQKLDMIVEKALKDAALWDEVKDELRKPASQFSGGQQQRLCIARALAVEPEVLLLDEPTSALDPIATKRIELLLEELSEKYTIIIVTHNLAQAIRISDHLIFLYRGDLIEFGRTSEIVSQPKFELTEAYLNGKIS
ncbi:MAG: phosphate ABC transporter ATP-binding protein [Thermotogae bacterium]|nr:phosphate ABC transporter ATP-binding protein [Thermotogota bacterium]